MSTLKDAPGFRPKLVRLDVLQQRERLVTVVNVDDIHGVYESEARRGCRLMVHDRTFDLDNSAETIINQLNDPNRWLCV